MTTTIDNRAKDSILSENWVYMHKGSEAFNSQLGLLRVLLKLKDDPIAISTLVGSRKPQVRVKYENSPWERVF